MTETPEPLVVPEGFSETIHKNIQTISLTQLTTGKITDQQLLWLIDNVKRLEKLTIATATLTNAADNFIASLKRDLAVKEEENRALEQENARMENDNLALLQEIAEKLTDLAEETKPSHA